MIKAIIFDLDYNGLVKLDTKFAETRENDKMKIYDQTTKNI